MYFSQSVSVFYYAWLRHAYVWSIDQLHCSEQLLLYVFFKCLKLIKRIEVNLKCINVSLYCKHQTLGITLPNRWKNMDHSFNCFYRLLMNDNYASTHARIFWLWFLKYSRSSLIRTPVIRIRTVEVTVLLGYFVKSVCFIRVVD